MRVVARASWLQFSRPPPWTLATGPVGLLEEGLPSLFGVLAMRDARGTLEHGVKAALLAPGLRSIREWTDNDLEPADVLAAIDAWDVANPSGGGR